MADIESWTQSVVRVPKRVLQWSRVLAVATAMAIVLGTCAGSAEVGVGAEDPSPATVTSDPSQSDEDQSDEDQDDPPAQVDSDPPTADDAETAETDETDETDETASAEVAERDTSIAPPEPDEEGPVPDWAEGLVEGVCFDEGLNNATGFFEPGPPFLSLIHI